MVALLLGLIGKAVSWLADVLPESPFIAAVGELGSGFEVGLAWLNTFVPVGQIAAMVTAWAVALVAVVAVRLFKRFTLDKVTSVFDLS